MALYTFNADITLPLRQYEKVVDYYEHQLGVISREYMTLAPTFRLGRIGSRLGEIIFTYATEQEFAGVLFVSDSDRDVYNYNRLLEAAKLPENENVGICTFDSHFIAGKRNGYYDSEFATTSVLEDNVTKRGQIKATNKYRELRRPHISEYQINPNDVYQIARMIKGKPKSTS